MNNIACLNLSNPTPQKNRHKKVWKDSLSLLLSMSLLCATNVHAQQNDNNVQTLKTSEKKQRSVSKKPARTKLQEWHSKHSITVKFNENTDIRVRKGSLKSRAGADLSELENVLAKYNIKTRQLRRYFNRSEAELDQAKSRGEARSNRQLADLNLYFMLNVGTKTDIEQLCDDLNRLDIIEFAEPDEQPAPQPAFETSDTPDFTDRQGYKGDSPLGINADGLRVPGALGNGIQVVDIEYDWVLNHEDLQLPDTALLGGATIDNPFPESEGSHGTAVLGMLVGGDNGYGVTGIVPNATALVSPTKTYEYGYSVARAVTVAAASLNPGDVMLLETQTRVCNTGEYGPSEYVQATFDAISTATANGIVVIAAAGNGSVDLDSEECAGLFDREVRDSGAIIVGASYSTSSTTAPFSSYGSRVDVHGWGYNVTTTGYGTLYDTGDITQRYTYSFSGTSSASPIVTGSAVAIQGSLRAANAPLLTSIQMRELLSSTGTPQSSDSLNVGPLPNIKDALLTYDRDGDDLLDSLEVQLGTNPDLADTDGDGVSDFDELNQDGDPTNYTAGVDTDPLTANDFGVELLWPNGIDPVASAAQDAHPAGNVGDSDISTRWSAQSAGQTITFDLAQAYDLSSIKIAFLKGDSRKTYFDLATSTDGINFTTISTGIESSGTSSELERFNLSGAAQFVRIIGQGNSSNDWNSITEVEILGSEVLKIPDELSAVRLKSYYGDQESQTLNITSNVDWNLTSSESWITVTPATGSGNGSSVVTVADNVTTEARTGTLTLMGGEITQTLDIYQRGKVFVKAPTDLSVEVTATGEISINWSDVSDNETGYMLEYARWTEDENIRYPSEFITLDANTTGKVLTGLLEDWYYVSVYAFNDEHTSSSVTRSWTYVQFDDIIEPFLAASDISVFSAVEGSQTLNITANVDWTLSTEDSWITLSTTSGSNNGSSVISVTENTTQSHRQGTIILTDGSITETITIGQSGFIGERPSGLTVKVTGEGEITINWFDESFDETGYLVEYARYHEGESSTYPFVAVSLSANTESHVVTGLLEGWYYVRVSAVNGTARSVYAIVEWTNVVYTDDVDPQQLAITNATSSSNDGNVVANTLDDNLDTRWSANGEGEFATFDLGEVKSLSAVNIAFFKGDSRNTYFSIAVSENGTDFTTYLVNEASSGDSVSLEEFSISAEARYVRIIGHGNSSNTWNSLTEVQVWGTEL